MNMRTRVLEVLNKIVETYFTFCTWILFFFMTMHDIIFNTKKSVVMIRRSKLMKSACRIFRFLIFVKVLQWKYRVRHLTHTNQANASLMFLAGNEEGRSPDHNSTEHISQNSPVLKLCVGRKNYCAALMPQFLCEVPEAPVDSNFENWSNLKLQNLKTIPLRFRGCKLMGIWADLNSNLNNIAQSTWICTWKEEHIDNIVTSSKIMSGVLLRTFSTRQEEEPMMRMFNSIQKNVTSKIYGSQISLTAFFETYLRNLKICERLCLLLSQSCSSTNMNTSLWGYGTNPHSQMADYVHLLRKNVFQTATKDADPTADADSNKNDDSKTSALSSSSSSKIWRKRNVTNEQLFQFTENLRVWMSANILVPLVKNIDECNKLLRASAPEIQIGSVGVDKLKKAAHNITGVKKLGEVFPFLDLTIHQDYLIHRLRELSSGGAISAYRWNGGSGSFNGKPWKEEFPTDTAILLHLFVMYMDQMLPPDIQQQDGRMFSNVYLVKAPEKPTKPTDKPILHLSEVNPPHLKVLLPTDEECDVGSGRNNFIHSLLLFIHHVTYQQHSHIANIHLTLSGVNLAWVVKFN
ncbi:unnamed protein product, partial [Meganyctiphanes norvegica]